MIDVDATLADMLAGIGWQPRQHHVALTGLADDRISEVPQCRLSFHWRPTEPNIVPRIFSLYLKAFPQASFDSLFHDLGQPVQHGIGNAVKRAHDNNQEMQVHIDHYFTKSGVVVAITDQGNGFDYRRTVRLYNSNSKYFTNKGAGFKRFAKCGSMIGYGNSGRTILVQYYIHPVPPDDGTRWPTAGEIVENMSKAAIPLKDVYKLARCAPELLRSEWKSSDFMETYIHSVLPRGWQAEQPDSESPARLLSANTHAATVRYAIGDKTIIAYFFRHEKQGARTYEILRAAWQSGLGSGQRHQVPQPLAYYSDRQLLLAARNDAPALDSLVSRDKGEVVFACRRAGRWLQKFHSTPIASVAEFARAHKERRRTEDARVQAEDTERPASESMGAYAGLLRDLRAQHEEGSAPDRHFAGPVVPVHGRFSPDHVLLGDRITTAIDFDRSAFGEPRSDLAKFAFHLWDRIFEDTGQWQSAEKATEAFFAEYGAVGSERLVGVTNLWGGSVLRSLERQVSPNQPRGSKGRLNRMIRFHLAQLQFMRRYEANSARPVRPTE